MRLIKESAIIFLLVLFLTAGAYYSGYTYGYFIGCKDAVRQDMEPQSVATCFNFYLGAE